MKRTIVLSTILFLINSAFANEHEGKSQTVETKRVKVLVDQDRLTAKDFPNNSPMEMPSMVPGPRPSPHPMTTVALYYNSAFLLESNWTLSSNKTLGFRVDAIVKWAEQNQNTLEADVEITTVLENRTASDDNVDNTSGPVCIRDIFQMVKLNFVTPIAKDIGQMWAAQTVYLPAQRGPCEK